MKTTANPLTKTLVCPDCGAVAEVLHDLTRWPCPECRRPLRDDAKSEVSAVDLLRAHGFDHEACLLEELAHEVEDEIRHEVLHGHR